MTAAEISAATVHRRFATFVSNIRLTDAQRADGLKKYEGITACLNRNYYYDNSPNAIGILGGSWGKDTTVHIDVLLNLPLSVYERTRLTRARQVVGLEARGPNASGIILDVTQ
jgi:hypothetical protein